MENPVFPSHDMSAIQTYLGMGPLNRDIVKNIIL